MISTFFDDLALARDAEIIVKEQLSKLLPQYRFKDVSAEPQYYHMGDIIAIDKVSGDRIFIEVKKDGCIAKTHNLLCEEKVYYYETKSYKKGNFHSGYDVYCVFSEDERKIYVMDFRKLKEHYKSGKAKIIRHSEQDTYCYLCPLQSVRSWGAMIAELDF